MQYLRTRKADDLECYLVVRHHEDITEPSSTDVICNFICDLKWVLERGSSYCSHIWANNNTYYIYLKV